MASASSSALSSPPPEDDETKFNRMRQDTDLSYEDFGYFGEEVMNGLGGAWFPNNFKMQGLLQGIWKRHPKRQGKNLFLIP